MAGVGDKWAQQGRGARVAQWRGGGCDRAGSAEQHCPRQAPASSLKPGPCPQHWLELAWILLVALGLPGGS